MMPKPPSRPRCPACYGAGTVLHPFTDDEVRCEYCDGERFDPYYMGPDWAVSRGTGRGVATPAATPSPNVDSAAFQGRFERC